MLTSATALEVKTDGLSPAVRKQAAAYADVFRAEEVVAQIRAAIAASETGAWNPDLNKAARTLTEVNPADYHGKVPRERQRRMDRSGWVAMPDRILTFAEDRVRADAERIARELQKAHGETTAIRYIIWAGMGGSGEVVRAIGLTDSVMAAARSKARIFVLDASGPQSLEGVLEQILRAEARREPAVGKGREKHEALLVRALQRTLVLGVSMGMTSEEPVINMTALEKIFSGLPGMSASHVGAHFWAMTLEGSTLHEFLKVKGWGDHRIAIQLDGENRSTLSGRNSYGSRVGLLPFAFLGAPVRPYVAAQAAPHFSDDDRLRAFALGAALAAAEKAGFSQPTFLLPDRFQPVGFWLMQQMEESLGKDGRHLMKVDVAAPERLKSLWPAKNKRQKRVFIHVRVGSEKDANARTAAKLAAQGYPVLEVRMAPFDGPMGPVPTLLHAWTHAVFAVGYLWDIDTVGQYYVEMYKKYVQLFILEAMAKGGFGEFQFETVNTPAATQAKQKWLRRDERRKGAFTATEPWQRLVSSPRQAGFDGLTLYYEGLIGAAPRVREADLARGVRALGVRALDKADAAQVYASWLAASAKHTGTSYAELTFYGDLVQTSAGQKLREELQGVARDLFEKGLGLNTHVIEGPRDNHSRLEMSTAGRNEGLITLWTSSLEPLKAGFPAASGTTDTLEGYLRHLLQSYPPEYLPMQTLATFQSYLDHGRRVVLIAGDVTPERVAGFKKQVQKHLKKLVKA
jgi:glucose-6-phosphate isomerase